MTNKYQRRVKALGNDRAIARSVISNPPEPTKRNPTTLHNPANDSSLFWMAAQAADEIAPWGVSQKVRDAQLRKFITQENIFAGALGIICSRNAGFSWTLDGPERVVDQFQYALETANQGRGWHDLMVKTTIDLSTQDNGAFWEIVRANDSPSGAFLGVNHLDAARCTHTGNPEAPVIYQDRESKLHLLKWYQVIEFAEMPASVEGYYGLQYCALTRLLRKAQIQKQIDIFEYEKTGGRNTRAIHMVKGITSQQLTDAINAAKSIADASGLVRYMDPVVLGTIDPKADVGHDTINLVDLPEGYNAETQFKQYINMIAMVFESDYQEFAPLPGGGLGTGAQSEMLHLKSRGKGPANFMKMITHAINFKIAPKNVVFKFSEQDLEAEKSLAEVKSIRAQTRSVRIQSLEISPMVARQIANDEGDLSVEMLAMMAEQDLTTDVTVTDESQLRKPGTLPSAVPGAKPEAQVVEPQRGNVGNQLNNGPQNRNGSQKGILNRLFGKRQYERKSQKIDLFGLEDAVESIAEENQAVVEEVLGAVDESITKLRLENEKAYANVEEKLSTGFLHGLSYMQDELHDSQKKAVEEVSEDVTELRTAIGGLVEIQRSERAAFDAKISAILGALESTAIQNKQLAERVEEANTRVQVAESRIKETVVGAKPKTVRKEVKRLDPDDPRSPIVEVIEHYE